MERLRSPAAGPELGIYGSDIHDAAGELPFQIPDGKVRAGLSGRSQCQGVERFHQPDRRMGFPFPDAGRIEPVDAPARYPSECLAGNRSDPNVSQPYLIGSDRSECHVCAASGANAATAFSTLAAFGFSKLARR